jgi:hypothetical protein
MGLAESVRGGSSSKASRWFAWRGLVLVGAVVVGLVGSGLPATPALAAPSEPRPQEQEGSGFWDGLRGLVGGGGDREAKPDVPRNVDLRVDDVPRDEPATKAVNWPQPKRVGELTGRRTANTTFGVFPIL